MAVLHELVAEDVDELGGFGWSYSGDGTSRAATAILADALAPAAPTIAGSGDAPLDAPATGSAQGGGATCPPPCANSRPWTSTSDQHDADLSRGEGCLCRRSLPDTAIVLPRKTLSVEFDADCHNAYHGEVGMMALMAYQA